jgi:uncharacterized membrane protein YfcA
MAVACALHGSVGFGMALVAAPLLILIDPTLVPAPIIVTALLLLVGMILRERTAVSVSDVAWPVAGCAVGVAAATALLIMIPPDAFLLVFGIALLLIVGVSMARWAGEPTPRLTLAAGFLSGLMGTTTSIGGPPLALAYQNASAPRLRTTLSVYFTAGALLSLTGLAAAGRFGIKELELSAFLIPGMLVGLVISHWTKDWLRPEFVRPAVLIFSTAAALIILVRYFS